MPERILLVTPDLATLSAAVDDPAALGPALGSAVAAGWVSFPGALRRSRDAVAADPAGVRWGVRLFVVERPRTLVGWGGFKGPPRAGTVELGYEIAAGWRRRGLATQAVRAMLAEAFAVDEVRTVLAHTLARPGASTRVLEKAGFARVGVVTDEQIGRAWRFRIERPGRAP